METSTKHSCRGDSGSITEEGQEDFERQRIREFAPRSCLLVRLEDTPASPITVFSSNVSTTRRTARNRPNWTERSHEALTITEKHRQLREAGDGEDTPTGSTLSNDQTRRQTHRKCYSS